MKKAIIYARVSSSGAQENRQNTERQVVSLTEYARLNGYEVIKTFEEHISGGKKNAERTGLLECLNYAKENKGTTILVSELSRYGRQIWEVLESIKFCVDNGINVYFQKEGLELFDGDKVNGVMAIYISCLSFCAEKERENIAFRLAQGREMAIQKGVKMGRKTGSVKTLDKLHYVADYEGRSVNSHILVLVRDAVAAFEAKHGPIVGDISPDVNVKPGRK